MVNDLLEMDGDVIRYTSINDQGMEQLKEVILDEHDTMWSEYQHCHIADCMRQIPEAFKNFAKEKRYKTNSEKVKILNYFRIKCNKLKTRQQSKTCRK